MSVFGVIKRAWWLNRFLLLHKLNMHEIEQWQSASLRKLVLHATRNVPAYKRLYAEHAVDPNPTRDIRDLEQLPIITKDFFLARPVEEYTDNSRPIKTVWKKTSGSSGKPLTVLLSDAARDLSFANFTRFRFLLWHGAKVQELHNFKIARIDVRARPSKNFLFVQLSDFRADPKRELLKIAKFQPDVLAAYTSILLDIAAVMSADPTLPLMRPRYVVSFGEMLSPLARRRIASAFGCDVYDQYGMAEVSASIAVECARHDGMHVSSESVIVEIVDDAGRALPDRHLGRVVATDLFNYNMPFIRYDTGDHGRISREPCPCGIKTPRIWIKGRYSAYLTFRDRRFHHLEFDGALDGFMNLILQYQVIKRSEDRLTTRIIPGVSFHESDKERVREKIREVVGDSIIVEVQVVEQVSKTPYGKSRIVLDESMPPVSTEA